MAKSAFDESYPLVCFRYRKHYRIVLSHGYRKQSTDNVSNVGYHHLQMTNSRKAMDSLNTDG
jgi:hypothetical protein